VARALRSHVRCIYVGAFPVDYSATRDLGCPPGAWSGVDSQSDVQAALFLNPYFLIAEVPGVNAEGTFQPPEVPWSLRGALLINLVQSLVQSAVMHQKLSVAQRLENSMTCHVLLDICRLLSHEREQQWSLPRGSCFLATQTVKNLQD